MNDKWMRREIERVGDALYTNSKGHYTGTEEDLHCIGQTVEGVCDAMFQLESLNAELVEALEKIKDLLGPNSIHGVARSDKQTMPIWEAISVGEVFEFADKALAKARGE